MWLSRFLGQMLTGWCVITTDCPHLLSCTGRKGNLSVWGKEIYTRRLTQIVPLHWKSHPVAVLSFLQWQQEVIQLVTVRRAGRKRMKHTEVHFVRESENHTCCCQLCWGAVQQIPSIHPCSTDPVRDCPYSFRFNAIVWKIQQKFESYQTKVVKALLRSNSSSPVFDFNSWSDGPVQLQWVCASMTEYFSVTDRGCSLWCQ